MNRIKTAGRLLCALLIGAWSLTAQAQAPAQIAAPSPSPSLARPSDAPGAEVNSLLAIARAANPEYAGMRLEAEAAAERIEPAGALPDPKLRAELMNITRDGEQNPNLLPGRAGSTRYTLMQDLPWFGKRDLKREMAELDAQGAKDRALVSWNDVATKVKSTYAQLYYLTHNESLTREILDLMRRLEKIAQARYAGGLAAQQDVIRAQVEQTALRSELIALETEHHHLHVRMNALLSRPANAPLANPERLRPLPAPVQLDYAALEARAQAHNPLLATEDARFQSAEKNRDLTYKNRYPDFAFGIAPTQIHSAIKEWSLMVEMNIPLQQETRRAREREAEALLAAAHARRTTTANQVLADLAENLIGLDAARRIEVLVTDSLLPQSELSFNSALAGYENGKLDFATLLDAQRQIRQARQNRIKAQAEGQVRLAEIERILGEDL